MPKSNSNGNDNGVRQNAQPTIHLILQGKGGVGKSLVASWLAEFLLHRGQPVRCIDGDPVNRSLGQFKAFAAEKLDLLNRDGVLERTKYDVLMNRFLTEDAVFVVDSGATSCRSGPISPKPTRFESYSLPDAESTSTCRSAPAKC